MSTKQKIKQFLLGAVFVVSLVTTAVPGVVSAQTADTCERNPGMCGPATPSGSGSTNNGCETDTAIIKCENVTTDGGVEQTGLWSILILALNVLTGLVAVAALGGLVWGSILYTSAGGSQEQTKKAMTVITNVVIGIVAYGLMYVGLNFLIPGGVFN